MNNDKVGDEDSVTKRKPAVLLCEGVECPGEQMHGDAGGGRGGVIYGELSHTTTYLAHQAAVLQRGGTGGGGVGVVPTHDHLPGVVADVVLYAPVRKSYHRVCFLLPHVKPIRFLPTTKKKQGSPPPSSTIWAWCWWSCPRSTPC